METKVINHRFVQLSELKANLRLVDDETFDTELTLKLNAAIAQAGLFIGRDLSAIESYSYDYVAVAELEIPSACHIVRVEVGSTALMTSEWAYADGILTIYTESSAFTGQTVKVGIEYNDDIKVAILMHASALFQDPVDSVEQLPKASQNMLRHYRTYGV